MLYMGLGLEAGLAGGAAVDAFDDLENGGDDDDGDSDDSDEDEDPPFGLLRDNLPVKVQPGLFIGSCMAELNREGLRQACITHVLQVAEGLRPSHKGELDYLTLQVQDVPWEDLVARFAACFEFIDKAVSQPGGSVLVHCMAGVSRSATVVIGYMMWKERVGYDEAFRRVHKVRPWVMPNEGFRRQLQQFEELGFDLSKWRAWRHSFREQPTVVRLWAPNPAVLGLGGGAGGDGNGEAKQAGAADAQGANPTNSSEGSTSAAQPQASEPAQK